MKKFDFIGLSIYPVSYALSIVLKIINNGHNIFEPPASLPFWLLVSPLWDMFDFVGINRLDGGNGFLYCFFVILTVAVISTSIFVLTSKLPLKRYKFFVLLALYIFLVVINGYTIEVDM
jgi:hypothetical protein